MTVINQLGLLESSGLIRLAQAQPELEYLFRHALVQDAAYASLLREDRRRLHQVVGEMLERLYPERLDELAPVLGHHFGEAGNDAQALKYFTLAGDQAMQRYAVPEAVMQYTHALDFATRAGKPPRELLRARGQAHELLGNFDQARADYQASLEQAHGAGDLRGEWQVLLDLGLLWAGSDYRRTGEYYQRALSLAQRMDDPAALARSLNHVGNWHLNRAQPHEAFEYQQQALAVFEKLGDRHGIAEALDQMGIASSLDGDGASAVGYYRRAIALFEELGDRRGQSSCYATMSLRGASHIANVVVSQGTLAEGLRDAEQALRYAREISWRAGEAFAHITLGMLLTSQGEYARGLASFEEALRIAEGIQHHQWMADAHCFLGFVHLDLFAPGLARRHLEEALRLAVEISSLYWVEVCSAYLAMVCIAQHDFERARAVLDAVVRPDTPARTLGQRVMWVARAELALARGQADEALKIADAMNAMTVVRTGQRAVLRVAMLRGDALLALGRAAEAEADLTTARDVAVEQGALPMLWRCLASLGTAYGAQGRDADAQRTIREGQEIVAQLAANIPTDELRSGFVNGAAGLMK